MSAALERMGVRLIGPQAVLVDVIDGQRACAITGAHVRDGGVAILKLEQAAPGADVMQTSVVLAGADEARALRDWLNAEFPD